MAASSTSLLDTTRPLTTPTRYSCAASWAVAATLRTTGARSSATACVCVCCGTAAAIETRSGRMPPLRIIFTRFEMSCDQTRVEQSDLEGVGGKDGKGGKD